VSLLYCTTCGADLSQPAKTRRERILLVLTPFFLILLAVTLSYEIGVIDAVENGMAFGGGLALIYLFSALVFWLLTRTFKLPALAQSYWQAGLVSTLSFIASVLLAFQIGELFANESIMAVGPVKYHFAVLEILAVIFLPVFFAGLLAVSARARISRFPESASSPALKMFFRYAILLIPGCIVMLTVMVDFSQPAAKKAMVRARVLYELQAANLALRVIDDALAADETFAPLHFLKGITILDYPVEIYTAEDAVRHLERANELQPRVPAWLYRLSVAYDRERNGSGAIAAATEATSLLPGDAFLWQYLGDLNMKHKRGPASVSAYQKALELAPHDPMLLNNLAYAMLELDMDLPQALELARMSVELMPDRVFNLDTLAWAYYKNAQYSEALEIMSAIFTGRSEISPEVDFHNARILQAMGMLNSPLETFDKLLARPEIAADHHLFQQVYQARVESEKNIAESSLTPIESGPADVIPPESSLEVKKAETAADNKLEQPEQNPDGTELPPNNTPGEMLDED
jgi:tetratricopeptide (TPR) repeat protein